ncbi:MAG: hypothetical protein N2578_01820, partial [Bdellovibrionaceae bacterium]|nr:hypothetical protein [Pseudobdellovibrionaceae bacterium]
GGLATDCADAVYAARLIFAFENRLPFVIIDHTGGSNRISNKMSRWDKLPTETERVRAMIRWLGDVVSTKTLPRDTYPVAVNKTTIVPGTVWIRPSLEQGFLDSITALLTGDSKKLEPGHAELVKSVSEAGSVGLIGSTVPKMVRKLSTAYSFRILPVDRRNGLRHWIQPDQYGRADSLPNFSHEQFVFGVETSSGAGDDPTAHSTNTGRRTLRAWENEVRSRLASRAETREEKLDRYAKELCSLAHSRAEIVLRSERVRQKLNGGCMDQAAYEAYSTPSRDKRLKESAEHLADTVKGFFQSRERALQNPAVQTRLEQCSPIQIAEGRQVKLSALVTKIMNGEISSNPNDTLDARWGLSSARNTTCKKYE